MGKEDFLSFENFLVSAWRRMKSELLEEEDKHDFCRAEVMTMSMTESLRWNTLPMA